MAMDTVSFLCNPLVRARLLPGLRGAGVGTKLSGNLGGGWKEAVPHS